jgi:hypothetical protein
MSFKSYSPAKLGLLMAALAYFSFSFYEFAMASFENKQGVALTDLPGALGLGFRTAAGFIAVVAIVLYFFKGHFSRAETLMSVRIVALLEAAYWLSLLPSGYVGLMGLFGSSRFSGYAFFLEDGLPCTVGSIAMPVVLVKLFYELSPNRPVRNAIKWGLIFGALYILVAWLNNMGNWIYGVFEKGTDYVTSYPVNAFTFSTTTVGLLLLTLYAAYFAKKSSGVERLDNLNLRRVGVIIVFFGLYMDVNYMLWLIFGSVGGWGSWYAWMLGHNMDQWLMALPLLGLPLCFHRTAEAVEVGLTEK